LQATRIPPTVTLFKELKDVKELLLKPMEQQKSTARDVVSSVIEELEKRAIGAGTLNYDGLRENIMSCLQEAGVARVLASLEARTEAANPEEASNNSYFWGGRFHLFPETFTLPKGTVLNAWQHWCCGNAAIGTMPLYKLHPQDVMSKNARKRLSDYRFLMKKLEDASKQIGYKQGKLTLEECNRLYEQAKCVSNIDKFTDKNRKRRINQLSWLSVVKLLRFREKSNR
jgi:hypothetical protein